MKLTPKVLRFAFYGLIVAGILYLIARLIINAFDMAQAFTGLGSAALAGVCCLIPIVLGGIALANESK